MRITLQHCDFMDSMPAGTRLRYAGQHEDEISAAIFDNTPMAIEIYDATGRILEANPSALQALGIKDVQTMCGLFLFDKFSLNKEQLKPLKFGKSIRFEHVFDFEKHHSATRFPTSKTGVMHLDVWMMPLNIHGSRLNKGYLVQFQDISDRKRFEADILNSTRKILQSCESEKQHISLYLHDHLAQDLSTLKIGMDLMLNEQRADISSTDNRRMAEFSSRVQQLIQAVREISYDLYPVILKNLGFMNGLHQLCMNFSYKTGIHVDFFSAGFEGVKLDFESNILLYRLVQEVLNEIKGQSGATQLHIKMVASYPNIVLRFEDDDRAADGHDDCQHRHARKRDFVLHDLEERIRLLNGTIRLSSGHGGGNRIHIEVPYNFSSQTDHSHQVPEYAVMEQLKLFS